MAQTPQEELKALVVAIAAATGQEEMACMMEIGKRGGNPIDTARAWLAEMQPVDDEPDAEPAAGHDAEAAGDSEIRQFESFDDWANYVQSKAISPRKLFQEGLVLRMTGEVPKTVQTQFKENVRVRNKEGKLVDVFETNDDGTLKMVDGQPVPKTRYKITTYLPCIGQDGVRYRVAINMGFKKAIGEFMRTYQKDATKIFWKIATLVQKAGDADTMKIEKVA